jgi:hypothetical protein
VSGLLRGVFDSADDGLGALLNRLADLLHEVAVFGEFGVIGVADEHG